MTAAGIALLLIRGLAGFTAGSVRATADDGSTDVGFARDMQTHHGQAVQRVMIIRDKTTDTILRTVAVDIATS